ncbi:MAG: YbaK/EbsC family protein, partial [Ruminococcus sp.]|nr:YbaK/EbsC family protein [Ruminococcus sp.]
MSVERAKSFLKEKGLEEKIIVLNEKSATVLQAAVALGVSEDEIAKTLSFIVDDKPILIVAEGTARIDNKK